MISRRYFLTMGLVLAGISQSRLALAMKPEIYSRRGMAIKGYDPVAYFTQSMPRKGVSAFTHQYKGATFHFVSRENLEAFKANPEAYAPQYGGYCAWAVSHGYTASIDPQAWTIDNGKLYLNYSLRVRAQWDADRQTRIRLGDQNWPAVLSK